MSTFDEASLVFIPSGYKTSKAYSVKPSDGSGDLAFTRSNDTATRVGPDGLIEKVRTNLILQSQTFDNASWTKSLVTITDNFDTAPNGTLTADRFVSAGGAFPQITQARTVVSGTQYTASLYVKSDGTTQIAQVIRIGGSTVIFTPTNAWQRISTTFTAASSSATFVLATNTSTAPASSFVIWGAQLETGDIATDYIATTTAAVSVGPVANVPRLDYLGSSCPRLLLEPQRQNLALFSESFDNAGFWTLSNSGTITANSIISPDGYQNADTLNAGAASSQVQGAITGTSGAAYTVSIWVKRITGTGSVFLRAVENVNTPISVTSEWQRFTATVTSTSTTIRVGIQLATSGDAVALWGGQIELGSYATSYIPTLGAAVTRGADLASKTGISSLIGQTEGTVFAELDVRIIVPTSSPRRPISIEAGTDVNSLIINFATTGGIQTVLGGVTRDTGLNVSSTNGVVKIAIAYSASGFVTFVNGILRDTYTGAWTQPTWSSIGVGGSVNTATREFGDRVAQTLLFKTRLTNAQLAELTTL